jgi:hypothetical protein
MKTQIICGKCGSENDLDNLICQYCGQELSKIVEGKHEEEIQPTFKENEIDIKIKEKVNPFSQKYESSIIFGILAIIFGVFSILSFIFLVFKNIWFAPVALLLSILAQYFSVMQSKRCYGCLALIGKAIGIIGFFIIVVSLLVYIVFLSIINMFL